MITSLIGWIVFGAVVGALARFLLPGDDPMGCLATILLGVAGSFVGGFLVKLFFGGVEGQFQPTSLLGSLVGAILLLLIARKLHGRRV